MQPSRNQRFVFGEFEVDRQRGRLTRGGQEIALRPKSYGVLLYLLEHAGQLVPREEMLAAVWPGVVVTDDSIAQCLIELRRALGDDTRTMIRTVPRRGLILDTPVRVEESASPPLPQRRGALQHRWLLAVPLATVAALLLWWVAVQQSPGTTGEVALEPATRSIAVLRFTDLSPAGDQTWLADGLSEEIMHRLAQNPSLRVIARASSFATEGQPISAISEQLGVTHVLEGSLRRQGDRVRVTAQLVDATTSLHVWSRTYDRELVDMLAMQDEIARSVADSLEAGLADAQAEPDIDPRAHALYLEGRYFYMRRGEGDLAKARERYEEAVAISPRFARAWAGLAAIATARMFDSNFRPVEPADRKALHEMQRHAVEQALKFGPNLPEVQIRAARYYYLNGERARSLEHLEIARSLDPEHWLVRMTLANEMRNAGRIEEAIPLIRREIERDPLNQALRHNLVHSLIQAQQPEAAQVELARALELVSSQTPHSSLLWGLIPLLQILLGDFRAAATSVESMPEGAERSQLLAINQHALGLRGESDAALAQLISSDNTPWGAFHAAEVHAYRGEHASALDWLDRIDPGSGCENMRLASFVYYSPFLARLAGAPDWEAYRAGTLQSMRECSHGLEIDEVQAIFSR
jgi:TolB-like protein/DNA-binding winged helix-turn-helix (wHTH) protein/tetratricopeptide (TPR) repeat protein